MGRSGVSRCALDGGIAHIESKVPLAETATSVGHLRLGALGRPAQELTTGPRSFGEEMAFSPETANGMRIDEEYSFQGGTLRLGWGMPLVGPDGAEYWEMGEDGRPRKKVIRVGIWEGLEFSVHSLIYGVESSDLTSIFEQFAMHEGDMGIYVSPVDPVNTEFVNGARVLQDIPELGLLDIAQLSPQAAPLLPRRQGTRVAGGELFVAHRDEPTMYFLLVGETSRTYVIPHPNVSPQQLVDGVSHLEIAWEVPT